MTTDDLLQSKNPEVFGAVCTGPGTIEDEDTVLDLVAKAAKKTTDTNSKLLKLEVEDGWVLIVTDNPENWPGAEPLGED